MISANEAILFDRIFLHLRRNDLYTEIGLNSIGLVFTPKTAKP
jgi:hypothetical protein